MTPLQEAADKMNRAAIGLLKRREIDRIAAKHRPKISAFFRRQRDITLEKFKGYDFLFTESYRALREAATPNEFLTTHDMDRLWSEVDSETFDDLQKTIAGVESEGVQAGGNQLSKMLSIDPSKKPGTTFNLANPRAIQFFQKNGGSIDYIKNIQTATSDQLKIIIKTSIENGYSYSKTAKEISDKFDEFSRDRAQRIVVYETGNSYEAGNRAFIDSLSDDGVDNLVKQWNTSHDDKVSDICQENEDAGPIPLDEPFPSGDQQPLAHVNCRCYCTYQQAK